MKIKVVDGFDVRWIDLGLMAGDVDQLPLPHGGDDILGQLCDVFWSPPLDDLYVSYWEENKKRTSG